jgi:DNA-binding Lrp family transcriptional regulator
MDAVARELLFRPEMVGGVPQLSEIDARVLDAVQQYVPLARRPFHALAEGLGITEDECIARVAELRFERRIIRQISAIFDTSSLGYDSALVAGKYKPERIEEGARFVSSHPGVSHNYQRNHDFNLWYTLAVPPDSCLGLTETIRTIHELSGAETTHPLPSLRLFKIGVKFDLGEKADASVPTQPAYDQKDREIAAEYPISDRDRAVICVLQQDLPNVSEPFDVWASQVGCSVESLLSAAMRLRERRQMRRFSAVLRHRSAGVRGNVMGVWRVPLHDAEKHGTMLAGFSEVSHCYLRPSYPDWPYNLYTMVHGRTRDDAIDAIERMGQATGIEERDALWSVREFKKQRIRYFTNEIRQWESGLESKSSPKSDIVSSPA